MKEKINWELLARYFSGECSSEKKKLIESWMRADPKNKIEFDNLGKIWSVSEVQNKNWNAHEALKKVSERIDKKLPERKSLIIRYPIVKIFRYAAVFLIIAASTLIISRILLNQSVPVITEVLVPNGTTKEIIFPDNSKVFLDAGSFLTYSDRFGEKLREVNLEGEGYFEITGNPQIPFIVHAGDAVIKVIGTKFNVRAWKSSHMVKVVVEEGKVLFCSRDDSEDKSVIIAKNQLSTLPENGKPQKPQVVDVNQYLGWMNHAMDFHNVPLNEILQQLERWYNLTINIDNKSLLFVPVTINIPEQHSVEGYLNLISSIFGLKYEISGKNVTFSKRK
jgi:ferric-dicitrate binding protein FerR (iron transport regulator)